MKKWGKLSIIPSSLPSSVPVYSVGSQREVPGAEKYHAKYFATPDLVKQYSLLVRCFVSPIQLFSPQTDLRLSPAASAG